MASDASNGADFRSKATVDDELFMDVAIIAGISVIVKQKMNEINAKERGRNLGWRREMITEHIIAYSIVRTAHL